MSAEITVVAVSPGTPRATRSDSTASATVSEPCARDARIFASAAGSIPACSALAPAITSASLDDGTERRARVAELAREHAHGDEDARAIRALARALERLLHERLARNPIGARAVDQRDDRLARARIEARSRGARPAHGARAAIVASAHAYASIETRRRVIASPDPRR